MLISFFRAVVRFRRPIVAVEVGLAVVYVVVARQHGLSARERGFPVLLAVVVAGFVLALVANRRYRPVALVADPERRAFDTLAGPAPIFSFTAYLALMTNGESMASWPIGFHVVVVVVVIAAAVGAAWREPRVRLRVDGVDDRQALGSIVVPWAAFDTGSPVASGSRNGELVFAYEDPGLVRRHGLAFGRRSVLVRSADRAFLGAVIDHYVRHPEHRAAIGTEAELRRVMPSGR